MVNKKPKILIVDDEQVVCDVLSDELSERGYLCTAALRGNEALTKLAEQEFEVVLIDIRLPGMSGMEVLREVWLNHPNTATIMVTAVNDVATAVEAMKLGASDYIVKPFDLDRVDTSICTALETRQATDKSIAEMDAIARGAEARLDSIFGYSKMVTQETVDIARRLGIAEEEIQRWEAIRAKNDAKRNTAIKSSLGKLERSPLAQSMMGVAVPHLSPPSPDEAQN